MVWLIPMVRLFGDSMVDIDNMKSKFQSYFRTRVCKLTKLIWLIGKNSAGKSSLIKSIFGMLTNSFRKVNHSDFRLAGIHTDLGTFKDTIHGKDDKKHSVYPLDFRSKVTKTSCWVYIEASDWFQHPLQELVILQWLIFSAREAFENQEQFNFHGHGQVLSHSKFEVGDDVDNDDENHEDEVREIIRQMDELFSNYLKKEQEKLPQGKKLGNKL